MATFSEESPVRAAVRIRDGRIEAAPFDADGRQTESAVDLGPVEGTDIVTLPQHVSFIFGGVPVEG
jgi:hypothetical protein